MKTDFMVLRTPKTEPQTYRHIKFIRRRSSTSFIFMPWDYFAVKWISARKILSIKPGQVVLVAGKRRLRVFPDTIKELPRGWLTSRAEDNQTQLASKPALKSLECPYEFCLHYPIPAVYGVGHFLTQGEGTHIYVKYTCEAMKIFVFLTSWRSGKYAPAPSGLLDLSFVGGWISKKKTNQMLLFTCEHLWSDLTTSCLFQWYKWRNSCVEHESLVIPVILEMVYSAMHSCQIRLLQQSADRFSGK